MPGLIPDDLGGALVPDDYRAAAPPVIGVNALELACRQGVVLNRDGEPPDPRVEGGPLGYRPRTEDVARLQAEVEMQRRRVVQLHDKTRRHDHAPVCLVPTVREASWPGCAVGQALARRTLNM